MGLLINNAGDGRSERCSKNAGSRRRDSGDHVEWSLSFLLFGQRKLELVMSPDGLLGKCILISPGMTGMYGVVQLPLLREVL